MVSRIEIYASAHYTTQENGRTERMKMTLLNSVRPIMAHAGASNYFCAERLDIVIFGRGNINKLTESLLAYKPSVAHSLTFGYSGCGRKPEDIRKK